MGGQGGGWKRKREGEERVICRRSASGYLLNSGIMCELNVSTTDFLVFHHKLPLLTAFHISVHINFFFQHIRSNIIELFLIYLLNHLGLF